MKLIDQMLSRDPYLKPYKAVLSRRINKIGDMEARLTQGRMTLRDFASGHEYFGLHFKDDQWIFREWAPNATAIYLIGDMYEHMSIGDDNLVVDRGLALHKMIRFITLATAANGYLNFMGNEFGHPEWIDFPRHGNSWSYHYARRQWHLMDDPNLKYRFLNAFDKAMIRLAKQAKLLQHPDIGLLCEHSENKIIVFERAGLIFAFNFHPTQSYSDYQIMAKAGRYQMIPDSDAKEFGGHGRLVPNQEHFTLTSSSPPAGPSLLSIYIPNRTVIVLKPI